MLSSLLQLNRQWAFIVTMTTYTLLYFLATYLSLFDQRGEMRISAKLALMLLHLTHQLLKMYRCRIMTWLRLAH